MDYYTGMIILKDVNETQRWARNFAKGLHAPCVVALHGDLGMGKSEIVRAIIQELCGDNTVVPSPTFTLAQTYETRHSKLETRKQNAEFRISSFESRISHFDLYRITDASELEEIGLPHACANDITLIEWPEIAAHILPPNTIHVYITAEGDGRKLTTNS